MRLLFANSMKGLGGGERWLLDVAGGLRDRGHEIWVSGRTGAPLVAEARRRGFQTLPAPYANDFDPATLAVLSDFYSRRRPDLVVAQIQRAHRVCAVAAEIGPRVRLALRVGQVWPVEAKWINRRLWGGLSLVLANCRAIRRQLAATGLVPGSRLHVLYNGLRAPQLPPRHEARVALGVRPGEELVLCVARLARRKGHDTLLHAWRDVRRVRPRARLLLAGDGSERGPLTLLASRLGVADSVEFAGERPALETCWAAADVAVLASDLEGLPYAVLEAMWAGLPVVSTAVAGVPEMLEHERTGLLVPAGDAAALSREIVRALADPELRSRMAESALAAAAERFSYSEMLERTECLLTQAAR